MRKSLLLAALLVLCSVPLSAQYGYIGLYADAQHNYNGYCPSQGFFPIEMWIWSLPGQNGQMCVEFSIIYPANLIQSTVTQNDDILSVYLGTLADGMSACYTECQNDWHWIYHQTLYVTDPAAGVLEVGPHPEIGELQIASCLQGYPVEPCTFLIGLYYNDPCPPDF